MAEGWGEDLWGTDDWGGEEEDEIVGHFMFGHTFVDYTPTASSEDSTNYTDDNLKIYNNLRLQWRSTSTAQNTIVCPFSGSKHIIGVILDDVNFTSVNIGGTDFTIGRDERVGRYKIYALLDTTNSSITITIPTQSTTDGLSKFRIGRIVFLDTVITLRMNVSWPYDYSAAKPYKVNEMESGGRQKVKLGDYKVFQCGFRFNPIDADYEDDLWSIDDINEDEEFVLFENDNDTSKVYVCYRDGAIEVTEPTLGIRETAGITIKEVI
jgi:hypothetical protein